MTTRERLQNWYEEQKAALLAEGERKGRAEGERKGRAEGERKGRAEGERKGLAEGQRSLLAKLLRLKFGPLDRDTESRLSAATTAELGRWAERVLTAGSIDEIWS